MVEMADEPEIRELIASWLAAEPQVEAATGGPGSGGGLPAPPAGGGEVAAAARRLALRGLDGAPSPAVPEGLRLVAEALVVDEHPSASGWTPLERAEAVKWVALLVHRFGEDGVQELAAALGGQPGADVPDAG
ncbi:hypothetical protein [Kitasatospora sp. NPDC059327]|uniref:hypothetical protein n=1 Tax=Kitasatospora sp. NPDC059327 TaxID=3346803 RepID=UPI0036B9DDC3